MLKKDSGCMEVDFSFDSEEKSRLLAIAREAVKAVVSGRKYVPVEPAEPRLRQKAGAFVTLHLHGELRGCIGFIEARLPVYETVAEMAARAATADPRFDSVKKPELDSIDIEISILSPLRKIEKVEDVEVGRHGVVIERGYHRGLLLPQVATENRWDRLAFLKYVCIKAGLDKDAYLDPKSNIYVFTAEVFGDQNSKKGEEKDIAERA